MLDYNKDYQEDGRVMHEMEDRDKRKFDEKNENIKRLFVEISMISDAIYSLRASLKDPNDWLLLKRHLKSQLQDTINQLNAIMEEFGGYDA